MILTPDEAKEYARLYGEWRNAVNHGAEVLQRYGIASREFAEADRKTGEIWKAMRKLRGEPRARWAE